LDISGEICSAKAQGDSMIENIIHAYIEAALGAFLALVLIDNPNDAVGEDAGGANPFRSVIGISSG
jgi:hypothetical protein